MNALGYLRVMFTVTDIDDTITHLEKRGAKVVDKVVNYQDVYRLCYIRGPDETLKRAGNQFEYSVSHTDMYPRCMTSCIDGRRATILGQAPDRVVVAV